jgi:glycosyltransferase involved in cell wall biosynthesis
VLNQQKGIFDLLNAMKRIDHDIPPDVKLAVCGVDRDNEIQKAVESLKLTGRVEMKGWIEAEQKQELFEQTAINILPSYSEALPMSILETMAYGIPNIATDVAAIPEVIRNGENGILIKPGDVEGLAQAIRKLVLDAEKCAYLSKAGYSTVKENFTPEKHKKDLLRIYNEVLNEVLGCSN